MTKKKRRAQRRKDAAKRKENLREDRAKTLATHAHNTEAQDLPLSSVGAAFLAAMGR